MNNQDHEQTMNIKQNIDYVTIDISKSNKIQIRRRLNLILQIKLNINRIQKYITEFEII